MSEPRVSNGARCTAHGKMECPLCILNPSTCAKGNAGIQVGCTFYADDGMHLDTCPNRVNHIDGNGDWVMQKGDRIMPPKARLTATAEPEKPTCPAHGEVKCSLCSLNPSTCGNWVMDGRIIEPKIEDRSIFKDLDPRMFVLIKDMSKEDLLTEILDDQRSELSKMNTVRLREMVASLRVENFKAAIMKEAGLKVHMGPLGIPHIAEDKDDD